MNISNALATKKCQIQETLEYLENFVKEKLCYRCLPCVLSVDQALSSLNRIISKNPLKNELMLIKSIATGLQETAMCKKGKDMGIYLEDALTNHLSEFEKHADGICSNKSCLPLTLFYIDPKKCTLCGACKEICPENAILGEKPKPYLSGFKPFYIRNDKCTRCCKCLPICEVKAIEIL